MIEMRCLKNVVIFFQISNSQLHKKLSSLQQRLSNLIDVIIIIIIIIIIVILIIIIITIITTINNNNMEHSNEN